MNEWDFIYKILSAYSLQLQGLVLAYVLFFVIFFVIGGGDKRDVN